MISRQKYLGVILPIAAVAYFSLVPYGAWINFSPIPFWDMWDGHVEFYIKLTHGGWSDWWVPHNEHRIVMSRILFWMDHRFFSGSVAFLIVCNVVLMVLAYWLFGKIIRRALPEDDGLRLLSLFGVFILTFSWAQQENITWGFQSQFFLAQIVPLASFFLLYLSQSTRYTSRHSRFLFALSLFLGIASLGTMANGVMTLPFLFLLSLLYKEDRLRVMLILLASVVGVIAYFHGLSRVTGHSSSIDTIFHHPIGLAQYILIYLGAPFAYLFGESRIFAAQAFGGFFVLVYTGFLVDSFRHGFSDKLQLFLLAFIGYIIATAFVTGSGRYHFGLEQAFAGRYATPALMGWSAMLITAVVNYRSRLQKHFYLLGFVGLPFLLVPYQMTARHVDEGRIFEQSVAALAIELGVKDEEQMKHTYPDVEIVDILQTAVEENVSIFGNPLIRDKRELIGKKIPSGSGTSCIGSLDSVFSVGDGYRVEGWILEPNLMRAPESVTLLDEGGVVIGVALVGQSRPDVEKQIGTGAHPGFKGYLTSEPSGMQVTFLSEDPPCDLALTVSLMPFAVTRQSVLPVENLLSVEDTESLDGWYGSDFFQSSFEDIAISGSWVSSDADIGQVVLRVKRGEAFFYRSGPSHGNQVYE